MGGRPKVLSGEDVVAILERYGFVVHSQKGTHVKMRRHTAGITETLVIPLHDTLAKGTVKGIFNQASRYIASSELYVHFYNS
jgi:predicted RNA binding protein YcfA (HicA-like mRNA interferase family)